jgi:Putative auto-transporter adhesin, head GIN domain
MTRITLALAASLLASSAFAGTPVQVGHFDQIELRGGGHVVVKHGAGQSVTLIKGSADITGFHIRDGSKLVIDACDHNCPSGNYDLEIEIVTPALAGAAIDGGGHIQAESGFPQQREFAAAVDGGGHIDMSALGADQVEAAIDGGGHIEVSAIRALHAAVDGGGSIVYHGDPQVTQAIDGGGSVSRAMK